ncbi:adenylylsulfate reductase subunit alpha [Clostridia bacterium]|nr:adenylylsulfate reductase subunit alpha [Clostridia bacterium]
MKLKLKQLNTDFLIIGGGTAGCYAALTFCEHSDKSVLIAEKANIRRSGCLAAGVNALNAYIVEGRTPQDYVDYAREDAHGIIRGDLLLTMSEGLNRTTAKMEELGLTILKNPDGTYAPRGNRNLKINGENIKPLLAEAVSREPRISVLNRVNVFEYVVRGNRIYGAYAVSIDEPVLYVIRAKAVLCATGGAAGLYKPNNPGFSRHKMWYPPFNTGAGYGMGIRAGAEMTTLEMRFVALRCKDTIAPTGTLSQGVHAKQINSLGEVYEQKYGLTTSQRLHGTVVENLEGRGPCYLRTAGISLKQDEDLQKAYLNMAPSQTLHWIETDEAPSGHNVEIQGTEPYITGGHTASGYWVDTHRETTIRGLFAAGDAAGGCPQKYVTGAFAEGEIAAKAALKYMNDETIQVETAHGADSDGVLVIGAVGAYVSSATSEFIIGAEGAFGGADDVKVLLESRLSDTSNHDKSDLDEGGSEEIDRLEEEMQSIMDEYAGGISRHYRYSEESLKIADEKIRVLTNKANLLKAGNMRELVYMMELTERLTICRGLIAHLCARKETRWPGFAENTDYPDTDSSFLKYINSRLNLQNDEFQIIFRDLVSEGEIYEH